MAPGAAGASGSARTACPGTWRQRVLILLIAILFIAVPGLLQAHGLQPPVPAQLPPQPLPHEQVPAMPLPDPPPADSAPVPPQATPTPAGPDLLPPAPLAPAGFAALDRDRDGLIDPAEASADPLLADGFGRFDRNGDHRLSRGEYAAYQPGPADAVGE